MVKPIKFKKVDAPSGCSIDNSGTFIVDNEPEYDIYSEDEEGDYDDEAAQFDYDSCSTTDTEEQQPRVSGRREYKAATLKIKEYDDELQEETDFRVPEKNVNK